jgi:NitT/TauT family transport system permease protein
MKFLKKVLTSLAVLIFWLMIWQAASMAVSNDLLLPSPIYTAKRMIELATASEFYLFTALSLLRVFAGIIAAIALSLPISAICSKFKVADRVFAPAVILMKSTPVVSFILIAIFLVDRALIPTIITFMMVFPVLYENLREGIRCTSRELIEMSRVFGISWVLRIKRIYLPAIKPFFYSAIYTSVGLAVKAGVAAEVIAYIPLSIGKELSDAKSYMEPADIFAWTAVIIVLSLVIEKLLRFVVSKCERRVGNA